MFIKHYMKKLYSRIMGEFTFDVYMLSDSTRRVVYIASTSVGMTRYFVERLCDKDAKITKMKRIYAWELKKFVNQYDAVFIDMHKLFACFFDGGFFIPWLVGQTLNIDGPLDEAIKLNDRELRKVEKYSCEISKDINALKFFYDKMYTPSIRKKYGDSAVEPFDGFEEIFRNGELVFVKLNDEYVSAYLCKIDGDRYYCRKNGVTNDTHIKEGALVAAYYFSILRAKEINAKTVDFGRSKPFLSDGVLRHKNLWGTRIYNDREVKRIIYAKNILFEQPFIYVENEKLKGAVFSEDDKLIKEYARSGLEFKVINIS